MFPFNITNPGFLLSGLPTSQEAAFLTNLTGLSYANGDILYYNSGSLQRLPIGTNTEVLTVVSGLPSWEPGGSGSGDVVGPATATDNALARFDSTTGKLLQNSLMTVDDAGAFIATDGSKVSGNEGGGFGYIVLAIENTSSGGRAELSLDTDDGAFAGFVAMAGSATTNEQRQFDIGTRVAGDIGFWTTDVERMTLLADGTSLTPKTNDTIALGTTTTMWSDLFLASGAVINFNNSNVVLTHSSNKLTQTGGALEVSYATDAATFNVTNNALLNSAMVTLTAPLSGGVGTGKALQVIATGESFARGMIYTDGTYGIGPGTATRDVFISRPSTNRLRISSDLFNGDATLEVAGDILPVQNDSSQLGNTIQQFSDLFLASGAVINFNNGNVTLTHSANKLSMAGGDLTIEAAETPLVVRNTINAASNEGLSVESDRATPANNDEVYQSFKISDSAGNQTSFARLITTATTVTDTSETADFKIQTISAGTLSTRVVLNATAFRPNANDGIALGSATVSFSDLFLASGGVINFNNGNATLTHSTGLITSNVAFSIGTSNALTAGTIELGAASDTTISRVSAGVIAVEGVTVPTISSTNTLTNKRITPRTGTTTSSATPTINTDNVDFYSITAQTVDITSFTTNLSGTPTDGQKLWIAITGTAARAITWGSSFEASTVALPTTTVSTNRLDVGFVWNAVTSKWRCIASA